MHLLHARQRRHVRYTSCGNMIFARACFCHVRSCVYKGRESGKVDALRVNFYLCYNFFSSLNGVMAVYKARCDNYQ